MSILNYNNNFKMKTYRLKKEKNFFKILYQMNISKMLRFYLKKFNKIILI